MNGPAVKQSLLWTVVFTFLTGLTFLAARQGVGVTKPSKEPISIREGSTKSHSGSGRRSTRFFVGGGVHGGK